MISFFPQFPRVPCSADKQTLQSNLTLEGKTMDLWVLSDLHLTNMDTFGDKLRIPDADLCIVAGDVSDDLEASMKWMSRVIRPRMPVLYVLGNHCLFGRTLNSVVDEGRQLAKRYGIILLENDTLTCRLDGREKVRFVGATMWTDFNLNGDRELAFEQLSESMPEYHHCQVDETGIRMRPRDAYKLHLESRTFIEETLATPFDGKTVLITHHCPHTSILERFRGDSLNPAFASDISDLIDYQPDLFIHGHTHASFDYLVGKTRILCNPRGNGGNKSFDWRKVVSV